MFNKLTAKFSKQSTVESYVRPSLQIVRTDSIDSNATAPNNPGPGRNVGRLYDFLGSGFEKLVNRMAEPSRNGHRDGVSEPCTSPRLIAPLLISSDDTCFLESEPNADFSWRGPPLIRANSTELESIESNATAPNLPGPGRNVGRLFDVIGSRIEHFLSKKAKGIGLGCGPDAVAQYIRNFRVSEDTARPLTKKETLPLRKACRKLLGYCRSQEPAMQLAALDQIIELVIEDPHFHLLFLKFCTSRDLEPAYKEPELHLSCAKAFISIHDMEVHEAWFNYERSVEANIAGKDMEVQVHEAWFKYECPVEDNITGKAGTSHPNHYAQLDHFESQIISYLNNPDVSFLVARYLRNNLAVKKNRQIERDDTRSLSRVWKSYLTAATLGFSSSIEGRSLSVLFEHAFQTWRIDQMVFDNANQLMQLACASMDVLRAINNLLQAPQLIGGEGTLETYSSEESKTYWLIFFLQNLCQSDDILAQLKFLQHLNKDTVILHHKFTFHSGGGHWIEKPWEDHHLDGEKLACFHEASVVLYYFYYGEPSEQLFAKQIIPNAMRLSRYSKMTFQAMASFYSDRIHIANPPLHLMGEPEATSKETHPILPMEFKLLSKSFCGLVLHRSWIMERKFGLGMEGYSSYSGENADYELHYSSEELLLWIHFDTSDHPLDLTGHYPILAGHNKSGEEVYVARFFPFKANQISLMRPLFTHVANGARNAIGFMKEQKMTRTQFDVLVLKQDPCDVGVQTIPEEALFQTGPVYWLREEV